jgi:hypothetical protein
MILSGFNHTYTIIGTVFNGSLRVDGVRTEIYFTTVGKETPRGVFFGDVETSKTLSNVLLSKGTVKFSGVWTSQNASFRIEFEIEGINFSEYSGPMETDKLCEFTCDQLTVKVIYEGEDIDNKLTKVRVRYFIPFRNELVIPKIIKELDPKFKDWLEYETSLGKIKIEYLASKDKIKVGINKGTFKVYELQLSIEVDYTNEELFRETLEQIEELIEDYLLLISIICFCKTEYYKRVINYIGSKGYGYNQAYRIVDRKDYRKQTRFHLFEWHIADELLKSLVPCFINHRDKYDIQETIKLFLAALHSEYAEVQLLLLQGALETVVNATYDFSGIEEKFCPECNNDLVRLRDKLIAILNKMNVKFDDLYPSVASSSEKTFPFIKYRNRFVHGKRDEIDYSDIIGEMYRQRYLVERLIINWIGYDSTKLKHLKLWEGIKPY